MNISYRNYNSEDVNSIVRFWNENSGWETNMDITEFNLRFCSCPAGEPILMLAIDASTDEISGLCCFLPGLVEVNKKTALCYRPFGAVVKHAVRQYFGIGSFLTGKHPIFKLYQLGIDTARQKGAAIIYLLPDPRWAKILKVMPFEVCKFPLLSYALTNGNSLPCKTEVRDLSPNDPEIDVLCNKSSMLGNCTLYKNAKFYEWKVNFRHGLYKLNGVYDNNKLIGVYTSHFKKDERQWLLGDLLSLDSEGSLREMVAAACNAIQIEYLQHYENDGRSYKIAILATTLLEQILKPLNFYTDNYNFYLAVQLLDKKMFSKIDVSPSGWHISAND